MSDESPVRQRITAEKAGELCGHMSWLDSIDRNISEAATAGKRRCYATDELHRLSDSKLADIFIDLRGRGFSVEKLNNPVAIIISW